MGHPVVRKRASKCPTAASFCLPLCKAVVEEEVGERVVEVRVVGADAVVLVRVGVLTEQDVGLLQCSTETMKRLHHVLHVSGCVKVSYYHWSRHCNSDPCCYWFVFLAEGGMMPTNRPERPI